MSTFDLKPSKEIVAAISKWEGGLGAGGLFHPYQDGGGVWTIGFGHTGNVGPHSKPLTLKQAEALLWQDLEHHYVPAVVAIHRLEEQKQFDATLSFVFNDGTGMLEPQHTFGHYLELREFKKAASSLNLYVHDALGHVEDGLVRRRKWEEQLFLGGTYTVHN